MPLSRYGKTSVLGFGEFYGTSRSVSVIRNAIKIGVLPFTQELTRGNERLDVLAGRLYGDGRHWWILAAASDIGWGLQVPPDTLVRVPKFEDVIKLIG